MPPKLAPECAQQCDQNQRDNRCSKKHMAYQNRKIDWPHPSPALKTHIANMVMVDAIGHKKRDRDRECAEHKGPVPTNPFPTDAVKTGQQQYRRSPVERGI